MILIRNLFCLFRAYFQPEMKPDDVVFLKFRVGFFDTDWFHSMQASQYLTFTDAARWVLAIRLGFSGVLSGLVRQ